ncbi:MAG: ThuA domain-containing protein, partial [Candidatus Hydrogenedentes bacterium]|nr:ThuA domain-containing protein [Candidatus Hydrogenedentota bacterium]
MIRLAVALAVGVSFCAMAADVPAKRVLLVTGQDYPGHKWQETAPVLAEAIRGDNRLEVVVTENPKDLASPDLDRYDAIVLHFMNWEQPDPGPQARENLKKFVEGGKGLVLVHFACGAFQEWPEFRNLAGRSYDPKLPPHDPYGPFRVEITGEKHPITEGLQGFETTDELYTCLAGDRPIKILATAKSKVDGKDYPMAFVLDYGQGRVFHSVLGHDAQALKNPPVAQLFRQAAAWAAGLTGEAGEAESVRLFNGKDLDGFYTFVKGRGRGQDPLGVFTVNDGLLRISGEEWGCVTTEKEFENFRVIIEFKWGEKTWGGRAESARDSGLLVHSVGEDGAYAGIWMRSIECQMIEGGTGDVLVVGDDTDKFSVTCPTADEKQGDCAVYQAGGKPVTINKGRVNWWGRDPGWKDVKGFRGARDVEKPVGEWNRYECIADGSRMTLILNGVVMNECFDVRPS